MTWSPSFGHFDGANRYLVGVQLQQAETAAQFAVVWRGAEGQQRLVSRAACQSDLPPRQSFV